MLYEPHLQDRQAQPVQDRVDDEHLGDMLIDAGLAMPWTGRRVDWCKTASRGE